MEGQNVVTLRKLCGAMEQEQFAQVTKLLIWCGIDTAYSQITHSPVSLLRTSKRFILASGSCKKASPNGVAETCTMTCQYDGKCTEYIKTEKCDCNGRATFSGVKTSYQVNY